MLHIDRLTGVVNFRDQSIFIAADVENGAHTVEVSVREDLLNIVQIAPLRLSACLVPLSKRCLCILMLLPELTERFLTDHIHLRLEYTRLGYLVNLVFSAYDLALAVFDFQMTVSGLAITRKPCDQFVTGVNGKRVNLMSADAILLRLRTVIDVDR